MEVFDVWITRYALTDGIIKCSARYPLAAPADRVVVLNTKLKGRVFYNPDWNRSEGEAIERAEAMRKRAIASKKKQLKLLESLRFEEKK